MEVQASLDMKFLANTAAFPSMQTPAVTVLTQAAIGQNSALSGQKGNEWGKRFVLLTGGLFNATVSTSLFAAQDSIVAAATGMGIESLIIVGLLALISVVVAFFWKRIDGHNNQKKLENRIKETIRQNSSKKGIVLAVLDSGALLNESMPTVNVVTNFDGRNIESVRTPRLFEEIRSLTGNARAEFAAAIKSAADSDPTLRNKIGEVGAVFNSIVGMVEGRPAVSANIPRNSFVVATVRNQSDLIVAIESAKAIEEGGRGAVAMVLVPTTDVTAEAINAALSRAQVGPGNVVVMLDGVNGEYDLSEFRGNVGKAIGDLNIDPKTTALDYIRVPPVRDLAEGSLQSMAGSNDLIDQLIAKRLLEILFGNGKMFDWRGFTNTLEAVLLAAKSA